MRAACASSISRAASSMTGPISVASKAGSPMTSSRIAPSSMARTRSAMSLWTKRTRSAEQRCPALLKAEAMMSPTTCSARADLAVARQEMQDVAGNPGLVQQPVRGGADQRGLLGGLGDDGVAGGERRRDLSEENGERKIPR